MKLDKIYINHLRMPLQSPFETSFGRIKTRDCLLLEGYCEGVVGYGECVADRDPGYSYETSQTAWQILKDYLIPAVLNKEIKNAQELQSLMQFVRGHPMAKASLEMLYWDVKGKLENASLKQLLGGRVDKVPVGVSVGIQESPQALVEKVYTYLSSGYGRIKIKIKPGRDISEVDALRSEFPDLSLQVDANSAYSLEASEVFRKIDRFGLILIEQPLAEDDLWDHKMLQRELKTPICLDESILSPRHARQALEMKACRVINIKAGRLGGLSQAVEVHNIGYSQKIPVWCGGMLETGVGRAANLALATLPGFTLPGDISATDRYYQKDITRQVFMLNSDSTIDVPKRPGLGIDIDQEAVNQYTLTSISIG
jgi:O-succinylbenzoate synthase